MYISSFNTAKKYSSYILIFLFTIITILYIGNSTLNILFADEYQLLKGVQLYYDGTLHIKDFFTPHNEHMYPLLRLILLLSTIFDNLNVQHLKYISVFIIAFNSFIVISMLKNSILKENLFFVSFIIISMLFSFRQWENLLWGMQIVVYISIMNVLLSIYFITIFNIKLEYKYLFFTILTSILATFSFGLGILIWPVIIFIIIIRNDWNKIKFISLFTYLFFFLICILFFSSESSEKNLLINLESIKNLFLFFLISCSNGIVGEFNNTPIAIYSLITGSFFFIIYVYIMIIYIRNIHKLKYIDTFFCIFLFGILVSLATSYARGIPFGYEYGMTSRYSSFNVLTILSAFVILYELNNYINKKMFIIFSIFIILNIFNGYKQEIRMSKFRMNYANLMQKESFKELENINLELFNWNDDRNQLKSGLKFLKENKLGQYYE